jgi:SSS family solute:Na+ symporter
VLGQGVQLPVVAALGARRGVTPKAGFWGLVVGTFAALITYVLYKAGVVNFGSDLSESFWGAGIAFVSDALVTVAVTLRTQPKPVEELQGLVWGMVNIEKDPPEQAWWQSPQVLGYTALGLAAILTVIFF